MNGITFFGFSPVEAVEDITEDEVFSPPTSSLVLSTDVTLIPFSLTALVLLLWVDDAKFAEEEFLRAGFPGWAEGRKYPKVCSNDSAAALLASFLFGPVPCAVSPATFTCIKNWKKV